MRHRISVCGLGVGEGMVCCLGFNFVGADVFRRHWRPSEMLKRQTVNQATACVRAAHTLHVGLEVLCNSQVGCVA